MFSAADVALLKIEASGLAWLPLGDSDAVSPEEEIRVLGYPRAGELGLGMIPAAGKVLGVRYSPNYSFLQFEAKPFDKGHSGGPVINSRGEVIGIAMGVFISGDMNVPHQLAVTINTAKEILPPQFGVMKNLSPSSGHEQLCCGSRGSRAIAPWITSRQVV